MDDTELASIAEDMIASLEISLHEYLEEENLPDNSITRAAFYQAGVNEMKLHPDEDPDFQMFMMTLVTGMRDRYLGLAVEDVTAQYLTKK